MIPLIKKRHTRVNKALRTQPIAQLYAQKRVVHGKKFCELEKQMCNPLYDKNGKKSPDRMDALVYCLNELFFHEKQRPLSVWSL